MTADGTEPRPLRVTVQLEPDDFLAWQQQYGKESAVSQTMQRYGKWLMAASTLAAVAWISAWHEKPLDGALIALVGLLIVVTPAVLLMRWLQRGSAAEAADDAARTPMQVSIAEDGLRVESPRARLWTSWAAVDHISPTPAHIFVFLGAQRAHIIPRRAFASEEEADAFLDQAVIYWERSRCGE